ncbi:hypothetical protein SKAU_G00183590 [Synaphobranchus kaupii]|uniref:C2H2-type domain-containing protein n=1 Tax=Synaphobranchus kaupii TaxID=118154 RepID=A0A9Q1FCL2_SYNKA|nr:hypothetical protein SKAU_G00183590 [Synaphobranchus kaupii]
MNATLPFIEEYMLSSMSHPPCQRVVDSTKLTNTNSQSESITDCMNCLRPASSGENIQAESVMDSSDYTGMEPTSISNSCEEIEESRERKTGYLMSREQKDILANMKEEEEEGERQSVKIEREDGVRDEEELWKEEEETDEQMEGHATDLVAQTDKLLKNGIKSEHAQWEGEELSTLVTFCLLKKPRVLIRRLEISNSSLTLSPPPHLVACQRGQGERSPWGQHELSPLRVNGSLTQKKGQVVTRKWNTISQLERPPKMLPSSSENGICAEASLISPVISPRNQYTGSDHTGQTVEVSSQVFACSQCPFVHTEEVNLHQHIEKVHPEELNTTLLVPPLQLLSAAMWQVLQQQDVLHYGKLEEFVSLVTEAFPELLSESQRTELTLGLQQSGCKTDPALEVLLWEFLSTLDQLLPVPDLTQTVSWLSAAPSVLEVCLQSVYYPDQLKTLLRHHRSLGQLNMNATLPFIEEYMLSSMSRPPCQRVVDSTKLTNTNSQSESITDCMNCLRPASSGENIQAESVMDSSDYTGMEPTSISNRCEDIGEKRERKTGYLMSREKKDLLTKVKEEEEEDGERQSVKMEREDGVRDDEELWKEEEETDEQMEGHAADLVAQTDKLLKNGIKSEHAQREGEELSTLVTSCLLKKPTVLIRRLEISNSSLPVSPPPHLVACRRGQGERSPWGQHELSPLRGNGSLTQKKGQVVTWKGNTIGQLERPPKMLPSSSENGICAEASLISPVISPRNQNPGSDHTGQTVEVSCQVFACSQCPFVHTEEVNLHQHIEKVHPVELNTTRAELGNLGGGVGAAAEGKRKLTGLGGRAPHSPCSISGFRSDLVL